MIQVNFLKNKFINKAKNKLELSKVMNIQIFDLMINNLF